MPPIRLRQTGESRKAGAANDAASEVAIAADGRYTAEHGGYVTAGRRTGALSAREQRRLAALAATIDLDARHPAEGAVVTTLAIGDRSVAWAGAPPTEALAVLVGALVQL